MQLPICYHRGAETKSGRFPCASDRIVHSGTVTAATCAKCPYADKPNRGAAPQASKPVFSLDCRHRGDVLRIGSCDLCGSRGQPFEILACGLHGECSLESKHSKMRSCRLCIARGQNRPPGLKWAYGLTTVPQRRETLLPRTLASLQAAGFDNPRLFVDGASSPEPWAQFGCDVTTRSPRVGTTSNWVLSLVELCIREPSAERYAIFQDDLVTCLNLREYLDTCEYPAGGYCNLYTFPENQELARGRSGWYRSNGSGLGAVALVLDQRAAVAFLGQARLIQARKQQDDWRGADRTIIRVMRKAGIREFVHNPSLVQHTGEVSTMGHGRYPLAPSFRGEAFDALTLLSR